MHFLRLVFGGFNPKRMPWALLVAAVTLSLVGALFITSAESSSYGWRHVRFLAVGVPVFLFAAAFDYRHLASLSTVLYVAGMILLGLLPFAGVARHSAVRWFKMGPHQLQPSEAMKYVVVIALATYFCYRARLDRLRDLAVPLALVLAPMALVMQQPDLGTSLLFLPAFFTIAFFAGVPLRNLLMVVAGALVLAAIAWFTPGVMKDYQKERVRAFLGLETISSESSTAARAASYNAEQATVAISGGGLLGQGWGRGRSNLLRRVPESHTDFIFPIIAEEWGLARTGALIAVYLLIALVLGQIAWQSRDKFGALVAGGVLTVFAFQSLLHIAISLRLAPITGLTLPLVSYGGSSLVSTLGGLGLAASVGARRPRSRADAGEQG